MKTNLNKNWWVLLVNGLLAILFGGLAVFATEKALLSISMYFGLLIFIGGVLLLIGAYDKYKKQKNYSLMFAEGFFSVILGALIMIFPGQTLKVFFIFIGIWALLLGLFKIYLAIVFGKTKSFRFILIIGGILLFAIGLLLLLDPNYVAGAVLKVIGAFFIVLGMLLVYYSLTLRNMGKGGE